MLKKPAIVAMILNFAARLRFGQLFLLVAGLFLLDLIIPDIIPFADEILLGFFTLLLVLLQGDIAMFSKSGSGWPQGAPRREWPTLAKRCNTADDRFPARPKGATQMIQYSVAALEKDLAILCRLRLVLDHLGSSEHGNITLKEYNFVAKEINDQVNSSSR